MIAIAIAIAGRGTWTDAGETVDTLAPIPVLDGDSRYSRNLIAGEPDTAWMTIVEQDQRSLIGQEQEVQAVPKAGLLNERSAG